MDRRSFLTASGAALASSALASVQAVAALQPSARTERVSPKATGTQQQQYRIGYTTNTRGGWEGEPFKGFIEARELGFRYVEPFGTSFCRPDTLFYPDDAEGLMRRMFEIGLHFVAITGGAAGEPTSFEDPALRSAVIKNHFEMARFSGKFGVVNQKTNLGRRRPEGTTAEDLRNMAITCEELGKRMRNELGMKLGIHAHLFSQLEREHEIEYMMSRTDPKHVGFVLDTGHIAMAGMDPLKLAKQLGHRVIEYHLKDVAKKDDRGTKVVPSPDIDMMKTPIFFPLGTGGIDFVGLKSYLDDIGWRGFLNVELDTSPWREPKESARISAAYVQNVLKVPF